MKIINDKKCLKCNNARCTSACPISTPIAEIMKLVESNEIEKAQKILFENNPFSAVCAYICNHQVQCYGNCILNFKNEPFPFYEVEKELSTQYLKKVKLDLLPNNNKKVAVIGGGPAGITVALLLRQKGCSVTIFDGHERICGVLRYGIPEVRLPRSLLDQMEKICVESGIHIRPNILIGPVITLDNLLEDGYDAIFIGTGVWNPRKLNIKGETMGHVHYAIDYLKSPNSFFLKEKVIVIGAGNVAMDAARTAKSYGKDVTIYYRKGFDDMSASLQEIEDVKNDNVQFELFQTPIEIRSDGVVFVNCENTVDENQKVITKEIPGSEHFVACDNVIIAVSQAPRRNLVSTADDLKLNKMGLLKTYDDGSTTKDKVFGAGDVASGSKTVVHAISEAKNVVKAICNILQIEDNGFKVK